MLRGTLDGSTGHAGDAALGSHEASWHWVKGHAGHAENERADRLAREGLKPYLPEKA